MDTAHTSVLSEEVIDGLNLKKGDVLIDGTFGGGGHSFEVCKRIPETRIIAVDQDQSALDRAKTRFHELDCDIRFVRANFRDLDKVLQKQNIPEADGILLDLGLSSDQLENSGRGFSFLKDEPLLMTYKANPKDSDLTASDIVNAWSEENIAVILKGYGEEKYAKRIAGGIAEARQKAEIKTTSELVKIIEQAVPASYKKSKIHSATKTFQAIRMAVNDELNTLDLGLKHGFEALKPGGRMAVISFHSLEDRIVKNFYKAKKITKEGKVITKKPIRASQEEVKNNRRSRSAKLRTIEKVI